MNDDLLKRMGKGAGGGFFGMERQRDAHKMERMMRRHDRDDDFDMYGNSHVNNVDEKAIYVDQKFMEVLKYQDDLDSEAEN
jgi:hypothetical protein